jgi:hypothetical protein
MPYDKVSSHSQELHRDKSQLSTGSVLVLGVSRERDRHSLLKHITHISPPLPAVDPVGSRSIEREGPSFVIKTHTDLVTLKILIHDDLENTNTAGRGIVDDTSVMFGKFDIYRG